MQPVVVAGQRDGAAWSMRARQLSGVGVSDAVARHQEMAGTHLRARAADQLAGVGIGRVNDARLVLGLERRPPTDELCPLDSHQLFMRRGIAATTEPQQYYRSEDESRHRLPPPKP